MSQALIAAFDNATPMTNQVNALAAAAARLADAPSARDLALNTIRTHLAIVLPFTAHGTLHASVDTARRLLVSLKRQNMTQVSALADGNSGDALRDELIVDQALLDAFENARLSGPASTPTAAAIPSGPIIILDAMRPVLNSALTGATGGQITDIAPLIAAFTNQATILQRIAEKEELVKQAQGDTQKALDDATQLRGMLAVQASRPAVPTTMPSDGVLPGYKVVMKPAAEVFFPGKRVASILNFDITTLEWDAVNPYLPPLDPFFEFDIESLARCLMAFEEGDRVVASGHTGTGKTTFLEQVANRTGFLFERINFDSEIGRLDLIGRDTLITNPNGHTVSKFIEGALVKAIQRPCILDCDEVDFIRPDVIPIFYRVTEKPGGLLLNEDGGRFIPPHALNRIAIAANTKLAGDESGAYVGTKAQPLALRRRFSTWIEFDYMPAEQEARVIKNKAPGVADKTVDLLLKLAAMVREAFKEGKIIDVITPGDLIAIAKYDTRIRTATKQKNHDPLRFALQSGFLNRLVSQDAQTVKEFATRVIA